jgi:hypothetical protein
MVRRSWSFKEDRRLLELAKSEKTPRRTASLSAFHAENESAPLAQFGLDAIDLRWTMKDIAAKRTWMINQDEVAKLIELGLVEMRECIPYLTVAGQNTGWE